MSKLDKADGSVINLLIDIHEVTSGARSMAEAVKKKYGKEGLDLINVLIK